MTGSDQPTPRATAHRLLAEGIPKHGTPDAVAAGTEQVFAALFGNLSQWVGTAGCGALFSRALVLASPHHPVLTGVRYRPEAVPHLDRLAENASEYGTEATAEGATAVLTSLIATLAGLVGEDITMSLLGDALPRASGPATPSDTPSDAASDAASGTAHPTAPQTDHGDLAS